MTHVLVGVAGAVLIVLMLGEFFVAFLLPRRVKRDPRIARSVWSGLWIPFRWVAGKLPRTAGDTLLGFYGPIGLLVPLALWAIGLVVGFSCLHWAFKSQLGPHGPVNFASDLYYSAGAFLSATESLSPRDAAAKVLTAAEAASGFGVLFIAIGYMPALYQSFSRREIAVSQLDPRAGSPPTAGALLRRTAERDGWDDLQRYLEEWEEWAAELMETHLSYPIVGYYRSQHVNQNWLAAITTVLDTSALLVAATEKGTVDEAELTYAIGRHALADLSFQFRAKPRPRDPDQLTDETFEQLRELLEQSPYQLLDENAMREKLTKLREGYEPYASALSNKLALLLPPWVPDGEVAKNWRQTAWGTRARESLG